MASSSASDISPPSKRARKFSKGAMTQYHQYSVLVEKLHREMLYTADTVERGREILTLSPERQPFTKCKEVLGARLGVVRMIRDGCANFEIVRGIAPEEYMKFMESMAFRLSNARKIFESAMQTAELVEHMAVSEDIPIPPHLAVLQPRPHAAAPPPVAVEAAPGVESIGVRVV